MANLDRAIISTLIYYDLLDRPLTELETFKYLAAIPDEVSFFDFKQTLTNLAATNKIETRSGLYFLPNRLDLIKTREKRLKLAQLKWKKLKKIVRWLALVPFLRLVAVTGSLTAYNTRPESDYDLLVVTKTGRLWLGRTLITGLCGLLRVRRHGQLTQDRICLNCYLADNNLKIKPEAKPHDFHSAQEYGRLTPVLEIKDGTYQQLLKNNLWLKQFLAFHPWSNEKTAKRIKIPAGSNCWRQAIEWLLSGQIGDWLEQKLGSWQSRRIRQKSENQPADQIYISDQCLMFHPQSKSYRLRQALEKKISELLKN